MDCVGGTADFGLGNILSLFRLSEEWGRELVASLHFSAARLERGAGPGNASTLHRLQHSTSPAPASTVPGGVAAWLQEVVTPVMLSLSGLVLGIAALILVLLVRHYKDEADTSLRLHQVIGASLLHRDQGDVSPQFRACVNFNFK